VQEKDWKKSYIRVTPEKIPIVKEKPVNHVTVLQIVKIPNSEIVRRDQWCIKLTVILAK